MDMSKLNKLARFFYGKSLSDLPPELQIVIVNIYERK